jgi:ribosomal protein S18 acetylase RimI-like enzyme
MGEPSWRSEPLDAAKHDRTSFDCGVEALDRYLKDLATQDVRRHLSRVFVVAAGRDDPRVLGYYSLSAAAISRAQLPSSLARKLPNYPIPAARIGRLAIHPEAQGRGLGEFLLWDACGRIIEACSVMAVHAIIVDAKDDGAASFYRHFGFIPFIDSDRKLFLPIATVLKVWQGRR